MRGRNRPRKPGFLTRLAKDTRGNVLALTAAAVIPMVGIVGSGIDMGRTYLVKTRLQQACDAGVLAARKAITGTALTDDAKQQGSNFFNINLRTGMYGAQDVTFQTSDVTSVNPATGNSVATGTVHGDATATVPMTLMKIFGKSDIALTATCEAELNVANNDIMFALDLTGSMSCAPADALSTCQNYVVTNTSASPVFHSIEKTSGGVNVSRIDALRTAVKNFYATVSGAQAPGTRLRVGFVPYSSNVNMGAIMPSGSMLTSTRSYDTRIANFKTPHWTPATGSWGGWGNNETYGTLLTTGNCDKYAANAAFTQSGTYSTTSSPNPAGNPTPNPGDVIGGAKPANVIIYQYQKVSWAGTSATVSGTTYKQCTRQRRSATVNYDTPPAYRFTDYTYQPMNMSLATFIAASGGGYSGSSVRVGTAVSSTSEVSNSAGNRGYSPLELPALSDSGTTGLTIENQLWDGCIEERLSGNDDIDGPASSDPTRWAPSWPGLIWNRPGTANVTTTSTNPTSNYWRPTQDAAGYTSSGYFCPMPAQNLQEMTAAQINSYVTDSRFVARGFTFHDIGMIWAARLMSQNSIFGSSFGPAPNGKPVTRHIIFMTDGDMETNARAYTPYGIEAIDQRISGGSGNLNTLHNTRFANACTAAKNKGIQVWVVAFGQLLTDQLKACATSNDQAFQANSAADLNAAFANIAARIADLRLTA